MDYLEKHSEEVRSFVRVCQRLSELMYVTAHGGNLAWKLEEEVILITPTCVNKGLVSPESVVFIDLEGKILQGTHKSTGETPMYLNFFGQRPDISTVIHCHPPATGAFAVTSMANLLERPVFPETTTEVGPVAVVPYGEPLTKRLADNFLPFLKKYNAFIMANHGLVIMSPKDMDWTMMMIELLEMTALSLTYAAAMGDVREIGEEDVKNLDNVMKARNLPMFGAPGVNSSLHDLYFGSL